MRRITILFLSVFAASAFTGCFLAPIEDDGETNCLAIPVCGPDEVEVETCPAGASCIERETCGTSILCQESLDQCAAVPVCDTGEVEVEECAPGQTCRSVSLCGATILCTAAPSTCLAIPTCMDTEMEVDACDPTDTTCRSVTECGSTIFCTSVLTCPAVEPSCPQERDIIVSQCPDNRTDCYEHDVCEGKVLCLPAAAPADCDAVPVCDNGETEVADCTGGASCRSVTECGDTILCSM